METADRLAAFGVTIFTEMTALALEHDAINLGQGFPNWDGADFVKQAAIASIEAGGNDQYPPSHGISPLREAIAERYQPGIGVEIDPATEVTVTCGCTEALAASFIGLIDPGDEVILIEPFYDAYPAGLSMAGAAPRYVTLRPPSFELDIDRLRAVFSERTRAIVVNNPHNPTGHVFDRPELEAIASLCIEFDTLAIVDEVYEEMTYGHEHVHLASLDGMWERSLTLSSIGKTFSLTGWKLGWSIAPAPLSRGVRAAHQFLTFTTPTPVQHGAIAAMSAPASFYQDLRASYQAKRDLLAAGLGSCGFEVYTPEGTYFMMTGIDGFGFPDDRAFARHLVKQAGVVAIPPSVFYHEPSEGAKMIRFAFCKDDGSLREALERLGSL
ncbi:MAG: aminotransferase class I/II-fold pyridoxal phosphate-dependent enzyme [Acidimicrobiia bacterium]